jgi:hypothetical protein
MVNQRKPRTIQRTIQLKWERDSDDWIATGKFGDLYRLSPRWAMLYDNFWILGGAIYSSLSGAKQAAQMLDDTRTI